MKSLSSSSPLTLDLIYAFWTCCWYVFVFDIKLLDLESDTAREKEPAGLKTEFWESS